MTHDNQITFDIAGDFAALYAANAALREAGFSVGSSQRGLPTAVMFGDWSVAKWGNLNGDERREVHGTLVGDNRNGPLTLRMLRAAPPEALIAFDAMLAARSQSND